METVIDLSGFFTLNLLVASRWFSSLFARRFNFASDFLPVPFGRFDFPSTDNHRISLGCNCGDDVVESKIDGDYVREEGCLIRRDINRTDQMGVVVPRNSIVGQLDGFSSRRVNVFSEGDWEGKILDTVFSFRSAGQPNIGSPIVFDDFESGLEVSNWRKAVFWTKSWRHGIRMPILSQRKERFVTVDDLLDDVLRRLRMKVFRPMVGFVLCLQSDSIQARFRWLKIKRVINIETVILHLQKALVGLAKVVENGVVHLRSRKAEVIENLLGFTVWMNLRFVRQVHFFLADKINPS